MRFHKAVALLGAAITIGACGEFDAPNQNYSTIADLTSSAPSRAAVATAAQGLLGSVAGTNAGIRNFFGADAQNLGQLGREAYNLDVSNPQNIPTFFSSNAGASFKNLTLWNSPYATLNQANLVITGVDNVVGATAAEKEGVKGYAQTIKAYTLFTVIRATDNSGAVMEALSDVTQDPPPFGTKAQVYARIIGLLDSAATHLTAAGSSAFLFTMTDGFAPFNTPAKFLQFTKGLRAKVNVTQGQYAAALADLGASGAGPSFLDTTKAPTFGAFVTFSTAGTDVTNGLYDPTSRQRYVHPAMAFDAQLQAGAAIGDTTKRDLRFLAKAKPIAPVSRYSFGIIDPLQPALGANLFWGNNTYPANNSPWPILTNEELALLRAEALAACTTTGENVPVTCAGLPANNAEVLAYVNWVRTKSGGLSTLVAAPAPVGPRNGVQRTTGNGMLDEILYNKRYSLFFTHGDRWVDSRRYGVLHGLKTDERAGLGDVVWSYLMIPINECLPRSTQPTGCTAVPPNY